MANDTGKDVGSSIETRATLAALDAVRRQNELLDAARKDAEQRLSRQWWLPKAALTIGTLLTSALAAYAFWHQFVVVSELAERSRSLQRELTEARQVVLDSREFLDKGVHDKLTQYERDFGQRLEQSTKAFKDEYEIGLGKLSSDFQGNQLTIVDSIKDAQRILTLVSMGREQVFLKHNPMRALVFADAAETLFKDNIASAVEKAADENSPTPTNAPLPVAPASQLGIINGVYPAIWNLQLECLLQLREFKLIEQRAAEVIGPNRTPACTVEAQHCALRAAFYYRALAGIDMLASFESGTHDTLKDEKRFDEEYRKLLVRTLDDLNVGVGDEPDRSIANVYKSLVLLNEGRYGESRDAIKQFSKIDVGESKRVTPEVYVGIELASAIQELLEFIANNDRSLGSFSCSLRQDALSPWDAHLLEKLIAGIVRNREWHVNVDGNITADESVRYSNQLGLFGVDWILSLRLACRDSSSEELPCAGCSPAGDSASSEDQKARAELMADFELRADADGPVYSRNKALGRVLNRTTRWMKVLRKETRSVERTKELRTESGDVFTQNYIVDVSEYKPSYLHFSAEDSIPAGPYVQVTDEDLPRISRLQSEEREREASASSAAYVEEAIVEEAPVEVAPPAPVAE